MSTGPARENHFAHASAARRYALGRPYFHPIVRDALRAHLTAQNVRLPVALAVDIACGTGLSTRFLPDLAERVFGFDSSAGMIAEALPVPR